jgi:hypothetical protein
MPPLSPNTALHVQIRFPRKPVRAVNDYEETYASRRMRLATRLQELLATPWKDRHAKRLIKRLRRHQNDLFTFLDQPDVPYSSSVNNKRAMTWPSVALWESAYLRVLSQTTEDPF